MGNDTPLLELRDVSRAYPAPAGPLPVLRGVSLRLGAGESLAVAGPSGCGKSTLLNIMGTLDSPDSGQVLINGVDTAALDARGLARLRNKSIGFVFQFHHLLPQCTVLENVLVPVLDAADAAPARDRAVELLEQVGLADRKDHRPGELSGGERQRAAVVRALINRPALLLADEPTGALNEAAAESLADLLVGLQKDRGMALVVVTHAPAIAKRFGRVCELHGGVPVFGG
ncbi:MAG: ABC transporter ATP-binding protein [Candidatus Hydrogenedens sp.]|nr:ABC transporter ATP-binding protein [Candidatus Hydrogenedentota bacterium]NLF57395.1 ABC transporter ATP-binding protein [Candidatus Hydrogenedens sp.]